MILRSLTSRLIFLYCVILLALGAAFLGFTVFSFRHYAGQVITNILANRSQDIWRLSRDRLDEPDYLAELIERTYSPAVQNRFIRIQIDGKTVYQSGEPNSGEFSVRNIPLSPIQNEGEAYVVGKVVLYAHTFKEPGRPTVLIETGQFQYALTVQDRLTKSLFVGLPILLFIAAIAGYLVMRRALTPIESMIRAAESYTFNDPHKRLPTLGSEPRIEALGLALNRMLDRLDNAYSHIGRFTSDAAHELRTPLTIIRGELELMMRRNDMPPEVEEATKTALEEVTRLSGLVDSLITLSRMDSLWGKTTHELVNLTGLAEETVDQMHLLLEERNILVRRLGSQRVFVLGDRGRLKQVLVNLLDNAVKYTPHGGSIAISVCAEGMMAVVRVEDTGIGVEPEHQQRIFDRFYRVSPHRGADGAGLGLAIVKSICQAHGGTVSIESRPGAGSRFTVEIPLPAGTVSTALKNETRRLADAH